MSKVYMQDGRLVVPDCVTVPFIEGDGVGAEITPVSQMIVNEAVKKAYQENLVFPILIGNKEEISKRLEIEEIPEEIEIINAEKGREVEVAIDLVHQKCANAIMKGSIETAAFMRSLVRKENGILKAGNLLNHITILEIAGYHKLIGITDAALLMYPSVAERKKAIENCAVYMQSIGRKNLKVSALAAIEKMNPKMPETLEADALKQICIKEGIADCYVEGPISYDLAISKEAAKEKNYRSPVAGDTDLLVVNNITSGNLLVKSLTCSAKAAGAGIVLGAKIPIILTSRSSSVNAKYRSILLAAAMN